MLSVSFFFQGIEGKRDEEDEGNLQLDGFIPVDHVTGDGEGLDVHDVDVPPLRAHVEPFALEREVEAGDPAGMEKKGTITLARLIFMGPVRAKEKGKSYVRTSHWHARGGPEHLEPCCPEGPPLSLS